jgi:hypothetical protein
MTVTTLMGDRLPVTPEEGLGASFEVAPKQALLFSAASSVAGVALGTHWEPTDELGLAGETRVDLSALRHETIQRDGCCVYCGLRTRTLEMDSVSDLHLDLSPENLVASDPICHGYHHMGQLEDKDARVAYVPGLDVTDVNHLQRVVMAELHGGDEECRADAGVLLRWLASHETYTKKVFGTATPSVFGAVISRVDESARMRREVAFDDLALVYNPKRFENYTSVWRGELLAAHPRQAWASFFQDVMRLTA